MGSSTVNDAAQPRDLRIVVRVLTPLIIAGLGLGMFVEYRRAGRAAERQFGEKQMYQARKAADRLAEVFGEVRRLLTLMNGMAEDTPQILGQVVTALREHGAVAAVRADRGGHVLRVSPAADEAGAGQLLGRLPPPDHRDAMCVRGPRRSALAPSGLVVVASVWPTGSDVGSHLVLDWGELQQQVARITKLSRDSYSWVLDDDGRLVMHPEHREQLGHSALTITESCSSCHTSFDLHRKMARGMSGSGRIQVADNAPRLVAFTPVQVGAHRWSLAVATPASVVVSEGLMGHSSVFVFIGGIMLVMIVGALLLDRESSRRIRFAEAFNRELEDKVAERTGELRELYDRLGALQAQQNRIERATVVGEMASIVAHEVRTPLNALSINAQRIVRLLRRGGEESRVKARELLGSLEGEIQRINNLLEDHLLTLVRHRKNRPECLDLNEQVTDAIRFMESEASRQRVRLVPSLAPGTLSVRADPAKLRQVLLNIMLNAIQAMPDGGEVRLTTHRSDGMASVAIQDTGPGIDLTGIGSEPGQVFRPFVTTKEDGTGLGLAICQRLTKEMSGQITVRSTPGEGACFEVTLPVACQGDEE